MAEVCKLLFDFIAAFPQNFNEVCFKIIFFKLFPEHIDILSCRKRNYFKIAMSKEHFRDIINDLRFPGLSFDYKRLIVFISH